MFWKKFGFWIVLSCLVACTFVVHLGELDRTISFQSGAEVWSDILRDLDQVGLRLTRVSVEEEMEIGRQLAPLVGDSPDPNPWQQYVRQVGSRMTDHLNRPEMQYEFHVISSPMVNAFAIPGGQVFITTGMLEFLETEAELAAILGHEIAHVDLRHCIERLQYALALEKIGVPQIGQFGAAILYRLLSMGYTKYQELEADTMGVRSVILVGYNPQAVVRVFRRLQDSSQRGSDRKPTTPVEAVTGAVIDTLESYADSHPPTVDRIDRIEQMLRVKSVSQKTFYDGKKNLEQRISRSEKEFDDEFHED